MSLSESRMGAPKSGARAFAVVVVATTMLTGAPAYAQWPQWGGPSRNFTAETEPLADSWPAEGPKQLWKKALGNGYSSIVIDDGLLYTMYRKGTGALERTVALDAATGKTVWEHQNKAPVPRAGRDHPGPNSTPLVSGDRLYTIGRNAVLHCFNKKDGTVLWKHDLVREFGMPLGQWGYSPSPIGYGDAVIVPVSRREPAYANVPPSDQGETKDEVKEDAAGRTLMAFSGNDGRLLWKSQDFGIDHSSPILITFDGRAQIVLVTPEAVFGLDPAEGKLLWQHVFDRVSGYMSSPVWGDGNLLFFSTPDSGSRVLELIKGDGQISPKELWNSRRLRMTFSNPVRVGEYVVGSGGRNPTILTCLNIKTGKRAWVDRTFGGASLVHGDGKLIILDESGSLGLASAGPAGLTVHSKCQITERPSYTAPSLVGATLYVRDRKHIMALDLG